MAPSQVFSERADAFAATIPTGSWSAATAPAPAGRDAAPVASTMSAAEMDRMILDAAILNGALELLPESLSTLAIIPLQMKLVYRIGMSYGVELDHGHIRDFLAKAGVGLASQFIEQAGRKLLGGLVGGIGRQAISSGMSFASTIAIGHLARRYYAGGRTMNTQLLREVFDKILGDARKMQAQYLPPIQA